MTQRHSLPGKGSLHFNRGFQHTLSFLFVLKSRTVLGKKKKTNLLAKNTLAATLQLHSSVGDFCLPFCFPNEEVCSVVCSSVMPKANVAQLTGKIQSYVGLDKTLYVCVCTRASTHMCSTINSFILNQLLVSHLTCPPQRDFVKVSPRTVEQTLCPINLYP